MFKKSEKDKPKSLDKQEISTLVGEGFVITGELHGNSVVRIDGRVNGNVFVESGIILGESGVIDGDLKSDSAVVYGMVTGNIDCGQLEVKSTAKVDGDVVTDNIEIEMGAQLNGKLSMNKKVATPQIQSGEVDKEKLQKAV